MLEAHRLGRLVSERTSALAQAESRSSDLQVEVERLQREMQQLALRQSQTDNAAASEHDGLRQKLELIDTQLTALQEQVVVHQKSAKDLQRTVDELNHQLAHKETEHQAKLTQLSNAKEQLSIKLSSAESLCNNLSSREAALLKEVSAQRQQFEQHQREHSALKASLQQADQERDQLKASLRASQESQTQLQTACSQGQQRIKELGEENETMSVRVRSVLSELDAHKAAMLKQSEEMRVWLQYPRLALV